MIRYILCPGEIESKYDGQIHYIGPMQLARLYEIDIRDCEIYEPAPWWTPSYFKEFEVKYKDIPRLYPRYHGDYLEYKDPIL